MSEKAGHGVRGDELRQLKVPHPERVPGPMGASALPCLKQDCPNPAALPLRPTPGPSTT